MRILFQTVLNLSSPPHLAGSSNEETRNHNFRYCNSHDKSKSVIHGIIKTYEFGSFVLPENKSSARYAYLCRLSKWVRFARMNVSRRLCEVGPHVPSPAVKHPIVMILMKKQNVRLVFANFRRKKNWLRLFFCEKSKFTLIGYGGNQYVCETTWKWIIVP